MKLQTQSLDRSERYSNLPGSIMTKEVEYSVKIENPDEIRVFLQENSPTERVIQITRDIYKNKGKYFVKISREKEDDVVRIIFSVKEDLLSQGIANGMKVAEEVDIEVTEDQLVKLIQVIQMFGFDLSSQFTKTRYQYEIDALMVALDEYENATNLEVEGPSGEVIMAVVNKIPFKS